MTDAKAPLWKVIDSHHLTRSFKFSDFKKALEFTNAVGAIAESQQHHPDILLGWGKVEITTYTHDTNSITDKDYKLAEAIDKLSV